VIAQRYIPNEP